MERRRISEDVSETLAVMRSLDAKLTEHMAREENTLEEMLKRISTAFPNADLPAHRMYHEEVMVAIQERADLRRSLIKSVATFGVLGILGWLCLVAWQAFLHGPQ